MAKGTTCTSSDRQVTITSHSSNSENSVKAWYVVDVKLDDVIILRNAFARNSFGTNIVGYPIAIAEGVGTLFAINGDYYGFHDTGIIIRDGVASRDESARQGLTIMRDGTMTSYDETGTNASRLISDGAWQTLFFGPTLIDGGTVIESIDKLEIDANFGNHPIQDTRPRTGLEMIVANRSVFAVVDGRPAGYSDGIIMIDSTQLFVDPGVRVAYNLGDDGSTQTAFNGSLVDNPPGRNKERGISDILWVGK